MRKIIITQFEFQGYLLVEVLEVVLLVLVDDVLVAELEGVLCSTQQ